MVESQIEPLARIPASARTLCPESTAQLHTRPPVTDKGSQELDVATQRQEINVRVEPQTEPQVGIPANGKTRWPESAAQLHTLPTRTNHNSKQNRARRAAGAGNHRADSPLLAHLPDTHQRKVPALSCLSCCMHPHSHKSTQENHR